MTAEPDQIQGRGLLVHEWFESFGGAEKVFDRFRSLAPDADVITLWDDTETAAGTRRSRESYLARTPLRGHKALALPLMPSFWSSVDIGAYDWVLASSHAFSHHVGRPAQRREQQVFAYVHSPARYIWAPEFDHRGRHPLARALAPALRSIDRRRAREGTHLAANSDFVRQRIEKGWGVDSTVIHPPVDVSGLQAELDWRDRLGGDDLRQSDLLPPEYILGASLFVLYKDLDRVI